MRHKGTANFIALRASSVLLLPLVGWFLWGAVAHTGASYAEMRGWLSAPITAVLMGLLIVIGAFHMRIGMNEIIEIHMYREIFMDPNGNRLHQRQVLQDDLVALRLAGGVPGGIDPVGVLHRAHSSHPVHWTFKKMINRHRFDGGCGV